MSRNDFDFSDRDDRPRFRSRVRARRVAAEQPPLQEITAGDVWTAVKSGFGMAFFIGIAAGVCVALMGGRDGRGGLDGDRKYLQTIVLCVVFLPMVWVPLALGARATSQRSDFTANLLRFLGMLFVGLYAVAAIAVVGMVLYVKMAKLGR